MLQPLRSDLDRKARRAGRAAAPAMADRRAAWRPLRSIGHLLLRPLILRNGLPRLGPPRRAASAAQEKQRKIHLRDMRLDLCDLLDQHPSSRQLLRHLWFVELTLARQGIEGLEHLPVHVLSQGLVELERVVADWSPAGLADLRSRLSLLVRAPEQTKRPAARAAAQPPRDDGATDVSEVSHSVFAEMDRHWKARPPGTGSAAEGNLQR